MSWVSSLWPMTVRPRSTPSSLKTRCWSRPVRFSGKVCVQMGTPVARWARAAGSKDALVDRVHGRLGRALDDVRADAGGADALGDVPDHQVGHLLVGAAHEMEGTLIVEAGGGDDLHARAARCFGDEGGIAAEVDGGEVDHRLHAGGEGGLQLRFGAGHEGGAVVLLRILLVVGRPEDEDVLVHEREAHVGGIERAGSGLDDGHGKHLGQLVRGSVRRRA